MGKQFEKPFNFKDGNLTKERYFELFGFTIFDFIHITMAIVIIITAAIRKEEGYLDEIGMEMLSLIFAFILIGFVDEMAGKVENGHGNRYFTFAWLVCAGAILSPEAFRFPNAIHEGMSSDSIVYFVKTGFTILGFFFLLFSLFTQKHSKAWFISIACGVSCIAISIPMNIWSLWIEENQVSAILETISSLAPIAPIAFTFISFHSRSDKEMIQK